MSYVVRYLFDGSLPPEGTVCPANPSPFLPATVLGQFGAFEGEAPKIGLPPVGPGL